MDREEILAQSAKGKNQEDERERYIHNKATAIAGSVCLAILSILIIYKVFAGDDTSDLIAVLVAFISVEALYKYSQYKKRLFLISGILGAIGAVASLIAFFLFSKG